MRVHRLDAVNNVVATTANSPAHYTHRQRGPPSGTRLNLRREVLGRTGRAAPQWMMPQEHVMTPPDAWDAQHGVVAVSWNRQTRAWRCTLEQSGANGAEWTPVGRRIPVARSGHPVDPVPAAPAAAANRMAIVGMKQRVKRVNRHQGEQAQHQVGVGENRCDAGFVHKDLGCVAHTCLRETIHDNVSVRLTTRNDRTAPYLQWLARRRQLQSPPPPRKRCGSRPAPRLSR